MQEDPLVSSRGEARRDRRQADVYAWTQAAFTVEQATSLPQRGLRLLEEAIEAFQAVGGSPAMAHKLIDHVFARPAGDLRQELGGVGVCVLALAAASGVSADAAERFEVERVLTKPLDHFRMRDDEKNAAGFLAVKMETDSSRATTPPSDDAESRVDGHGRETATSAPLGAAQVRHVVAEIVRGAIKEATLVDDLKDTIAAVLVDVVAGRAAERLTEELKLGAAETRRWFVERLATIFHRVVSDDTTVEELLASVELAAENSENVLRMSHALGEIAGEVDVPVSSARLNDVVQAVRAKLAEMRREVDRLGRETTMARLVTGFLAATDPSSTKISRDRLRRDLSKGAVAYLTDAGSGTLRTERTPATLDSHPDVELSSRSVDELDLSVRAANCLTNAGIRTLGDLTRLTTQDVLRIKWSYRNVARNVAEELAKLGLSLAQSPSSPRSRTRRRATRRTARRE